MGRRRILGTARLGLLATSCRSRLNSRHLRSQDDSSAAKGFGGRGAKALRGDLCRRKDYLALGYGWPRTSVEQPLQKNGEVGLDESSLLFAALMQRFRSRPLKSYANAWYVTRPLLNDYSCSVKVPQCRQRNERSPLAIPTLVGGLIVCPEENQQQ